MRRPQNSRYIGDLHPGFLQIFRMEQHVPHMYSTDDVIQIFSVDRISGIFASFKTKWAASLKDMEPSRATMFLRWVMISPASLSSNSKILVIISASLDSSTPAHALIHHIHNIFFGYIFLPGFYKPPDCNACCQEKQNHACQKDQARIAIVHTDLVISFFSHSVYTIHF